MMTSNLLSNQSNNISNDYITIIYPRHKYFDRKYYIVYSTFMNTYGKVTGEPCKFP